jgi:16S rRNA (cytosine1402-N4)-methyltransferase
MLQETLELLNIESGGIYVDATAGAGGHSAAILNLLGAGGRLVAMDRDREALKKAGHRLGGDSRATLVHARFSEMFEVLKDMRINSVNGVLFDYGVSMMQLRDQKRGFAFESEERLDMRMDDTAELSAWDVVNTWPEVELARVIYEYGEERRSRRIASRIVSERGKRPVNTCRELSTIVAGALGGRRGRIHPATRTFQGVRIAVNDEMGEIDKGLRAAMGLVSTGGRIVALSYHSLEDRKVKHFFKDEAREGRIRIVTKKPLVPGDEEVRKNPSARSAKLRAAEVQ